VIRRESMLPDNQSLADVLRLPPGEALTWVQCHSAAIDCCEDWQTLAYGWSSDAATNSNFTDDEDLALTTAAILIYDRLGEICPKSSDRYSFTECGMSSRAFVINKFGPQPGNPVQDPAILEDWFFRRLDLPHEEAVSMSKNSVKLSTEDFLRISSLKDRVRLMKTVQPQQVFRRRDELDRWYELLETSPGYFRGP
jgi:hypothetical protein